MGRTSSSSYGIHWFRRDLRLVGNPALRKQVVRHSGRVLGLFCFDKKFLSRPDFSPIRFYFFLRTLQSLREEMRESGGDLLCLDVGPDTAWPEVLKKLEKDPKFGKPETVSWNRDYEPFARERDARIGNLLEKSFGIETLTERDHLLIEPTELSKEDPKLDGGGFYQVYTPFKKKWFSLFRSPEINSRLREVGQGLKEGSPTFSLTWPKMGEKDVLEKYLDETKKLLSPEHADTSPPVGHLRAKALLKTFTEKALDTYPTDRDIPSLSGTSKISIYLKNGTLTVPQVIALLKLTPDSPNIKYLEELVWREFYYHILYHRPDVESQPFLSKYQALAWENRKDWYKKWCEGKTGFPIVDAGMRQLNRTGWMHNRVRMIVASFLTKDLLIDYRWGERYFMEKLLDGDLAPNNGGWQWAASTGCDPQPYFRIFNPTSQGEKFDPEGIYIRKWVPEWEERYRKSGNRSFHEPIDPIVDHSIQREKALELYKSCR